MANSAIEWTGKVWNPTTGCNKVSRGCKNCYAEIMHRRLMVMQPEKYSRPFLDGAFPHEPSLTLPFKWKKPTKIFVDSMSDLFHENVPFEYIDKVFAVIGLTPQHTYQILTKRTDRMFEYCTKYFDKNHIVQSVGILYRGILGKEKFEEARRRANINILENNGLDPSDGSWPFKNVWLGTSTEDHATADERIPFLLKVPAAVRWLSCEPLVGPIRLTPALSKGEGAKPLIHWVVAGGESGHHATPMHPQWVRDLRDECVGAGVKFFFKQWGEWGKDCAGDPFKTKAVCVGMDGKFIKYPAFGNEVDLLIKGVTMYKNGKHHSGRMLDGREWNEYPEQPVHAEVQKHEEKPSHA